jgi:hypothetical protein
LFWTLFIVGWLLLLLLLWNSFVLKCQKGEHLLDPVGWAAENVAELINLTSKQQVYLSS